MKIVECNLNKYYHILLFICNSVLKQVTTSWSFQEIINWCKNCHHILKKYIPCNVTKTYTWNGIERSVLFHGLGFFVYFSENVVGFWVILRCVPNLISLVIFRLIIWWRRMVLQDYCSCQLLKSVFGLSYSKINCLMMGIGFCIDKNKNLLIVELS